MNDTPEPEQAPRRPPEASAAAPAASGNGAAPHGVRARGESGLNLKPSGRVATAAPEARAAGAPEPGALVENPVFVCRDVSVFYGAKQALKSVSVDVGRGRCWR